MDDEQAECLGLMRRVQPLKISTYRDYLFWQSSNRVHVDAEEPPVITTEEVPEKEGAQISLDDLLAEAKSNTPATIDTHKTESPVVVDSAKINPEHLTSSSPSGGVDLGKRRTRNPSLITEYMKEMRPEYHEQELLLGDDSSDEDIGHNDPRSNTQLCNNDSIAHCSQDTFEEQSQQQAQVVPRKPLTVEQLKSVSERF